MRNNWKGLKRWAGVVAVLLLVGLLLQVEPEEVAQAASFNIANGDVYGPNGLIAAINTANGNGQANTINLASGGNYDLVYGADPFTGNSGLPAIGSNLTINGNSATLERSTSSNIPDIRIFYVGGSGYLTLNNLRLNNGRETGGLCGGAIRNDGGTVVLVNATLSNNTDTAFGGGICSQGGTLMITNSSFSGNSSPGGNGGGIYGSGIFLRIESSTFSGNVAQTGGGIYEIAGPGVGTFNLINSTFSLNSASGGGGGIFLNNLSGGTLNATIINSTFSLNSASDGGGIFNNTNTGIGSTTNVSFKNTLLANNSGGNCANSVSAPYGAGINNLEFPGPVSCGSGSSVAPANPLSGAGLANNGGATQTIALPAGSAAIDTGSNLVCADAATVNNQDQRGAHRSQGPACDIGAYEAVCVPFTVSSLLDNGACGTLRYAVGIAYSNVLINFSLPSVPVTLKLSGSGLSVPNGVTLTGICNSGTRKPDITIDGTGVTGPGLVLNGNDMVSGLKFKGFGGTQIQGLKNGNKLKCVEVSRS